MFGPVALEPPGRPTRTPAQEESDDQTEDDESLNTQSSEDEGEEMDYDPPPAESEKISEKLRHLHTGDVIRAEVGGVTVMGVLTGTGRRGYHWDAFREPDTLWIQLPNERLQTNVNVTDVWEIIKKRQLPEIEQPELDQQHKARRTNAQANTTHRGGSVEGPTDSHALEDEARGEGGTDEVHAQRHEQNRVDEGSPRDVAGPPGEPEEARNPNPGSSTPAGARDSGDGGHDGTANSGTHGEGSGEVGAEQHEGQGHSDPPGPNESLSEGRRRVE